MQVITDAGESKGRKPSDFKQEDKQSIISLDKGSVSFVIVNDSSFKLRM